MKAFLAAIKLILTLNCRHNMSLVSQGLDRPLRRHERFAMRMHMLLCGPCRRAKKQLIFLRNQFGRLFEQINPGRYQAAGLSSQARQRIRDAMAGATDRPDADQPAP